MSFSSGTQLNIFATTTRGLFRLAVGIIPIIATPDTFIQDRASDELHHLGREHLYRIDRLPVIGKTIFANSKKKLLHLVQP